MFYKQFVLIVQIDTAAEDESEGGRAVKSV